MPIVRPVYPNELYHYGVKGMHWGIRRYQPYPKGYSGSGKYLGKRSRIGLTISSKTKRPKISPEQREWLINRGSAKQLMEYGDQLTTEEKQKAIARMRADNDLMRMTYQRGLTTYNDFSSAVSNTTKIMKNLTDMPKTFGVRSGLSGGSKKAGSPVSASLTEQNYSPAGYSGLPSGMSIDASNYGDYSGTSADWYGIHGGRKVDKLTRKKLSKKDIAKGLTGAAAFGYGTGAALYRSAMGRSMTKDIARIAKSRYRLAKTKRLLNKVDKALSSNKSKFTNWNFDNPVGSGRNQLALNNPEFRKAQIKANPKAYAKYQAQNIGGRIKNTPKSAKIAAGALGAAALAGGIGYGIYKRKKKKAKRRR